MTKNDKNLSREKETFRLMARLYCKAHHQTLEGLCSECQALLSYTLERIDRCRYKQGKPACTSCPVHCYNVAMREKVRKVMRYAGPRMLLRHPILSLHHFLRSRGGKPCVDKT